MEFYRNMTADISSNLRSLYINHYPMREASLPEVQHAAMLSANPGLEDGNNASSDAGGKTLRRVINMKLANYDIWCGMAIFCAEQYCRQTIILSEKSCQKLCQIYSTVGSSSSVSRRVLMCNSIEFHFQIHIQVVSIVHIWFHTYPIHSSNRLCLFQGL